MSGKLTLFSSTLGDVTLPITATSIDGMIIGATTPAAATFTTMGVGVETGIVAGTTHTLVGATPLTGQVNVLATVANASDAVALPAASAALVGVTIYVFNNGADAAKVWPHAADAIDGGTAGVAVTLTNALRCRYTCVAVNTWISAQLGAVSA